MKKKNTTKINVFHYTGCVRIDFSGSGSKYMEFFSFDDFKQFCDFVSKTQSKL